MNIVRIATIPKVIGIDLSAIGIQASSEITSVITNSNGSISPIWRFPISLIANNSTANSIIALIKIIIIRVVCSAFAKICTLNRTKKTNQGCGYENHTYYVSCSDLRHQPYAARSARCRITEKQNKIKRLYKTVYLI